MTSVPFRIVVVAAARPNFMKVAPVMAAVEAWNASDGVPVRFSQTLVHTGQHYDPGLSDVFFRQLGLPEPGYHLGTGSGSHAAQTAAVLQSLEPVLQKERPGLVVVVGDVNSTIAAALCAAKLHIPVAHVEAGLRSGDRSMPEELNRLLTDQLADLLFTTERSAGDNLAREGVDPAKVHFVGNTMIDTLERLLPQARGGEVLARLGLAARDYGLVTLHRPSNVDDAAQLRALVAVLRRAAARLPLVWPVHPRTRARLDELLAEDGGPADQRLRLTEPLGYLDFLQLMDGARLALTDSGGIQEETTVLGVPCLTLRTTTERPVTVAEGTNRLIDPYDAAAIASAVDEVLAAPMPAAVRPKLWDGHAADRVVAAIAEWAVTRR
ncbi:MAG TPA: UDP-N-acetylglucosamine 2-epimerase (non-hydrolyzing) [Thermoleophilia bacterium]